MISCIFLKNISLFHEIYYDSTELQNDVMKVAKTFFYLLQSILDNKLLDWDLIGTDVSFFHLYIYDFSIALLENNNKNLKKNRTKDRKFIL